MDDASSKSDNLLQSQHTQSEPNLQILDTPSRPKSPEAEEPFGSEAELQKNIPKKLLTEELLKRHIYKQKRHEKTDLNIVTPATTPVPVRPKLFQLH